MEHLTRASLSYALSAPANPTPQHKSIIFPASLQHPRAQQHLISVATSGAQLTGHSCLHTNACLLIYLRPPSNFFYLMTMANAHASLSVQLRLIGCPGDEDEESNDVLKELKKPFYDNFSCILFDTIAAVRCGHTWLLSAVHCSAYFLLGLLCRRFVGTPDDNLHTYFSLFCLFTGINQQ